MYKYLRKRSKEDRARLSSAVPKQQDKKQRAQTEIQKTPFKHKDAFSSERVLKHWHGLPTEVAAVETPPLGDL